VRAISVFKEFILNSADEDERMRVTPFRLDSALEKEPSEFEITFLLNGVRHQYGFITDATRVNEEWLIVHTTGKPQEWFHRHLDESGKSRWVWNRAHRPSDKVALAARTRENALFLSVAAQGDHEELTPIFQWFRNQLKVLTRNVSTMSFTQKKLLEEPAFRDWLTQHMRLADAGIHSVTVKKTKLDKERAMLLSSMLGTDDPSAAQKLLREFEIEVRTTRLRNDIGPEVSWDLDQESDGTQRLVELLGPWHKVLETGAVLVVDDLDTGLQALVAHELVRLFHDPAANSANAQLVFTTRNPSLLDASFLRRDQVWFTEKDKGGGTDLYSLEEFQPQRGEGVLKGCLMGRHGVIPFLGELGFQWDEG
jgi:hypothetical protein